MVIQKQLPNESRWFWTSSPVLLKDAAASVGIHHTCILHCPRCHTKPCQELLSATLGSASRLLYGMKCSVLTVHTKCPVLIETEWLNYRKQRLPTSSHRSSVCIEISISLNCIVFKCLTLKNCCTGC